MVEVQGTSPNGRAERLVQIHRSGDTVSIWLHPPGSDKDAGWQALVPLAELRAALESEHVVTK